MRLLTLLTVTTAVVLTSCLTYEHTIVLGRWTEVSRADIAAAVAVARARPKDVPVKCIVNVDKLHRPAALEEIFVIGRDEIDIDWGFGWHDIIRRIDGRWRYVTSEIKTG
jgi:hypothetical protein